MEERENEMKQKKTGISAEKQEQWILQGKYVILAVLVGICVGIVDTIFGRGWQFRIFVSNIIVICSRSFRWLVWQLFGCISVSAV